MTQSCDLDKLALLRWPMTLLSLLVSVVLIKAFFVLVAAGPIAFFPALGVMALALLVGCFLLVMSQGWDLVDNLKSPTFAVAYFLALVASMVSYVLNIGLFMSAAVAAGWSFWLVTLCVFVALGLMVAAYAASVWLVLCSPVYWATRYALEAEEEAA